MTDKKPDVDKIIESLVSKLGYKLVKEKDANMEPELPKEMKNYGDMDSRQLVGELKYVQGEILKLEAQNERIKENVTKFMNDEQPNVYNRSVFAGTKFDIRKLVVQDKRLVLISNLRNHIDELMKAAIESEMTQKFVSMNPDFKEVIKNISIKPTPVGVSLVVEAGGKVSDIKAVAEKKKDTESGVTTTSSMG